MNFIKINQGFANKAILNSRNTLSYFFIHFQFEHATIFILSRFKSDPINFFSQHLSRHSYYIHIFLCNIIKNKFDGTWDSRCHRNVTQAFFSFHNEKLCQESRGCSLTCCHIVARIIFHKYSSMKYFLSTMELNSSNVHLIVHKKPTKMWNS